MGWTFPITYVVGGMVPHTTLNIYLRDNLNKLALHNHGDKDNPQLGNGSNWLDANEITFIAAAIPGAPGTNDDFDDLTVLFATGTVMGIRTGLTGTARFLSDSTHTHGGL